MEGENGVDVEIKRVVINERQRGVAILFAVIEYPVCGLPGGYFDAYYSSIRDNVTDWLNRCEIPRVRDEYFALCKQQYAPRFARYDYKLKCQPIYGDKYIEVVCEFSYSQGGTLIKQSVLRRFWSLRDGLMLKKVPKPMRSSK